MNTDENEMSKQPEKPTDTYPQEVECLTPKCKGIMDKTYAEGEGGKLIPIYGCPKCLKWFSAWEVNETD